MISRRHPLGCTVRNGLLIVLISVLPAAASDLSGVAKRLAKGMSRLPNKYVAVLPFSYPHEEVSSGSGLVAERLTTELVQRHVAVVERSQLDKVMAEIKLEKSGAMDAVSAQKLGKMLGVDAVVTGTLNDFEDQETEVNARLIRTETGEILAAGAATIDRPWTDMPRRPMMEASRSAREPAHAVMMSDLIPVHFGVNDPGPSPKEPASNPARASAEPSMFNASNRSPTFNNGYTPTPYSGPVYRSQSRRSR